MTSSLVLHSILTFLDFYLVSQLQIYRRRSFSSTFPDFKKALGMKDK